MRNTFFIFLLLIIFVGCKSIAFPYFYDTENDSLPYFETPMCDNNGNNFIDGKLKFGIDTGAPQTLLVKLGLEHLFGSIEDYYNWCRENNYELSDTAPVIMLGNINLYFGKYLLNPQFECRENDVFDDFAGIIGWDVLKKIGLVMIDFKKNRIIAGGKKIKKNLLPLKTKSFDDGLGGGEYLFIPVEIDGKSYDVMIDTGACTKGIPAIILCNASNFCDNVTVKIGSEKYNDVTVTYMKDGELNDKKLATHYESFFGNTIIIGNAFFQNHRIQLDFENMQFAMD